MAGTIHYPELHIDCIRELIEVIRNGELEVRYKEAILDAWVTAGTILGIVIGEPEEPGPIGADAETLSALRDLECVLADAGKLPMQSEDKKALPWALLIEWLIEFILSHIKK